MDTLPSYVKNIIVNNKEDIREILQKVRDTNRPQTIPGQQITIKPAPEKNSAR